MAEETKWTKDEALQALVNETVAEDKRGPYLEAFGLTPQEDVTGDPNDPNDPEGVDIHRTGGDPDDEYEAEVNEADYTKDELLQIAEDEGVDHERSWTKAQLVEAINAQEA